MTRFPLRRHRRPSHRVACVVACVGVMLWAACDGGDPSSVPALAQTELAVYRGQFAATEYPAVGEIITARPTADGDSRQRCSATLIGERTVLTAAHCIDAGGHVTLYLGGEGYPVTMALPHPAFNRDADAWPHVINDIALLILGRPVAADIKPVPLATTAPWAGMGVAIVGYGKTGEDEDDSGKKRVAWNVISAVGTGHYEILPDPAAGNLCDGDSGGPSFAVVNGVLVVVGVHSTKVGQCGQGGNDTRVDAFVAWLDQTARTYGGAITLPGVHTGIGDTHASTTTPPPHAGYQDGRAMPVSPPDATRNPLDAAGCRLHAHPASKTTDLFALLLGLLALLAGRRHDLATRKARETIVPSPLLQGTYSAPRAKRLGCEHIGIMTA